MTYFFIAASAAIFAFFFTALGFVKRIDKQNKKIRQTQYNALRWKTIAEYHHGIVYTYYDKEHNAWCVVRGYNPYRITIASFPCCDTPETAKALADDLAETLETFHYYAEP